MAQEEIKGEKKEPQNQAVKAISTPDKVIPKFCSRIEFGITSNNLVVMTMLYLETNSQLEKTTQPTVIERVIIDVPHARQVAQVLNDLLDKADNAKMP
jgi:hypothetical protein